MILFVFTLRCDDRNLDMVKLLIQSGADVNIKCCGTPCLHLALVSSLLPEGREFGMDCFAHLLLENSTNLYVKVNLE